MTQDILITPGSGEPQILFRGSGTSDTPIELNVLSSYQSASGSGTALVFEGQEGQLFAVTDNLSSGTIFSVGDITGLSMLSVDASGDVKLGEFANSVIVYPGLTLDDNVPSTVTNVLYNDGGDLKWNGITVVEAGSSQAVNGSGVAGYIAYWSDGNTLSYDSGQLFWDAANNRLGVGTASPSYTVDIVGNFRTDNIAIDGNSISATNSSGPLVFIPNGNGAFQIGSAGDTRGHYANDLQRYRVSAGEVAAGCYSTISGGFSNCTSSTAVQATVAGGAVNSALSQAATIGGGTNNIACCYATVGGGAYNSTYGLFSKIGGGLRNVACPSASYSFIGGGACNTTSGCYSAVVAGSGNIASGACSFVGGGSLNRACGGIATVAGGCNNQSIGLYSFIGGGITHCACSQYSTIGGGFSHNAAGTSATIAGGYNSDVLAAYGTIAGGSTNCITASGTYGFIGGGNSNLITGNNSCHSTIAGGFDHTINNASHATIGGGYCNAVSAGYSTIAGGLCGCSTGPLSFIGGGCRNITGGTWASVVGGWANCANGNYSFTGGGVGNSSNCEYSTIVGGYSNLSSNLFAIVVGGYDNYNTGACSFIGGGRTNCVVGGAYSIITGGSSNTITGSSSSMVGGVGNQISNNHAFIGGGYYNTASGYRSVVVGGISNSGVAHCSFIGGGCANIANETYSFIGGGQQNRVIGSYGTVAGGCGNVSCSYAAIGGGKANQAQNTYSTVSGGYANCANIACSTVSGGVGNNASGNSSAIGGGRSNTASATDSVVAGGNNNSSAAGRSVIAGGLSNGITASGIYGFIGGGYSNLICGDTTCHATIGGGYNQTLSGKYGTIGGGRNNTSTGCYSFTGGGNLNVNGGAHAVIGGGYTNCSFNFITTIAGGQLNCAVASCSFIGGGTFNTTCGGVSSVVGGCSNSTFSSYSFIGGGAYNTTCGNYDAVVGGSGNIASGACSFVGGGQTNCINASLSFIGGGRENYTCNTYTSIGGGRQNCTRGQYNTISGGYLNSTNSLSSAVVGGAANWACNCYAFVGGGYTNRTNGYGSAILGGIVNCITANALYASIGGGQCNFVDGSWSTIAGGYQNTVSGDYSAILGGGSNYDGGYNSVFILGTGITATDSNTTYTQKLNASYTLDPSGTIFNVEGSNGSIFSVVDDLSGALMSVNTIAGLPVLQVNADYSIVGGRFNQNDFVVTTSGDIGIGTANPTEKLHVYATGVGEGALIGSSKIGNWESDADYASFTHNDVHSTATSYALLQANNGTTFLNSASSTSLYFRINNVNSMIVDSSRSVRMLGDSTNNTWGSASPTLAIKRSNSAPFMSFHSDGGTRLGYLQFHAFADNIINGENYQDFVFNTNSLERMRIHKDGYVNFSNYLRIDRTNDNRGIVFEDSGGTDTIYMTVNDGQGNFNMMLGMDHNGNNVAGDGPAKFMLAGHSTAGCVSMNAGSAGASTYNIGLGLFGDDQTLRIGNPNNNIGIANYSTTVSGVTIADVDGDLITRYLRARDANGIQIGDDSDTLGIFVQDGGNVGIGTTSPNAVLHAYGSTPSETVFNVEGTNGSLFSVVDNLSGVLMSVNNNAGLPVFEVYDDDSIVAGRFAQNDFVITSSGNIGIGIDTPKGKLAIQGTNNSEVVCVGNKDGGSGGTQGNTRIGITHFSATSANLYSPIQLEVEEFDGADYRANFHIRTRSVESDSEPVRRLMVRYDGNVGIGTTSPTSKLHVVGDLQVDNLNLNGNTLSSTNTNGNLIIAPNGIGAIQGDSAGNTRGQYAVDLQRWRSAVTNVASGGMSTISGGVANTASGGASVISGGTYNTASGYYYSTVGGGNCNCASGSSSTVGGGGNNTASGSCSAVSGGYCNCASGSRSTVSGGSDNTASGYYSTVGGGSFNSASGNSSTVSGGASNNASASCSTVSGGAVNTASGYYSTVGGGYSNTASGYYSTVGGGYANCASGIRSTVGGGYSNTASGYYSTVGGGYANCAIGNYSIVSGGRSNDAQASESAIVGGAANSIQGVSADSIIGAGTSNLISASSYAGILSGNQNCISSAAYGAVLGGCGNCVTEQFSSIIGGSDAKTTKLSEISHASGKFGQKGDAQHSTFVVRRSTTDATANQALFLNGSNLRLTIPAETTWMFEIKLAAHNDTNNDGAWWTFRGGIRRDAANGTAIIGSVIEENSKDTNMSTASASVVADDTNEALEIRVTGVAAKNIRWVAVVDISQVSWGTP